MNELTDNEANVHRLRQVLALEGPEFLGQAYLLMLGRPIDPDGFRNYDAQLRTGKSKLSILAELRTSNEGQAYGANVPELLELLAQTPPASAFSNASAEDLLRMSGSIFVDQAYFAILGKCPDQVVRQRFISKLNAGTHKLQLLMEMLKAKSGSPAAYEIMGLEDAVGRRLRNGLFPIAIDIEELLALDDIAFVDCAYKTLLKRVPVAASLDHYLQLIRSGASKLRIVTKMRFSAEGRARATSLPGLWRAVFQYWISRTRLTDWWYQPFPQAGGDSPLECRVRAIENTLMRMTQERERESSDLDSAVDDVARLLKALADSRPA